MGTTDAAQNDQVCLHRWVDDRWQWDDVCLTADVMAVADESRMPVPSDPAASYFIAMNAATVPDAPFVISRLRHEGTAPSERQMRNWCRWSNSDVAVECMAPADGNACTLILPTGDHARVYVASSSATQILRPVTTRRGRDVTYVTRAQFERVVRAQYIADPAQAMVRGAALFCHLADYWLTPTMLFERWQQGMGLSAPTESASITEVLEAVVALAQALAIDNWLIQIHYDTYMSITAWEESTEAERNFAQARIKKTVGVNRALGEELADARRRLEALVPQYPELAAFLPLFEIAFPAINQQAISRGWAHIKSP